MKVKTDKHMERKKINKTKKKHQNQTKGMNPDRCCFVLGKYSMGPSLECGQYTH